MSSLSSASSNAAVWQSYDDNASFEEDASPAKAAAFITACRILLRRRPNMVSAEGVAASFDSGPVETELARARSWLALNRQGNGGSVRFLDFGGIRD